ncbi:hypothetical protein RZE82_05735 [Mollicutes bacterium LVI A0039]|nr:hypothetical protein RZE82_05735 [Mollicutes bacterium LVI A0039]
MIVGIAKILILFPFLPYLIFLITSKNRKMAHVYCGLIVLLSNIIILNYMFHIIYVLIALTVYVLATLFFATEKTKKKRSPKLFGLNVLFFFSWLGFRLYLILIIIGTAMEMIK